MNTRRGSEIWTGEQLMSEDTQGLATDTRSYPVRVAQREAGGCAALGGRAFSSQQRSKRPEACVRGTLGTFASPTWSRPALRRLEGHN